MRRRAWHRQGPLTWVLLALGLLLLLHWVFGSGGTAPGSWSVVSGRIVALSPHTMTVKTARGNGPESLRIGPGAPTAVFQRNGPRVPRALLQVGSAVRVLVETTQNGLVARAIAIRRTVITGRLQGWGPGRIEVNLPGVAAPVSVGVTRNTAFQFSTADPGLVRTGIAVVTVVQATPAGSWQASLVRFGS